MSSNSTDSFYPYAPSHILPAVFGSLTAVSLILHVYQNFHYRYWRITFFVVWAGMIFTTGWFVRLASSYDHELAPIGAKSTSMYIVQTVMILAAPPIYAAVEYNILARLLHYLPYHAPLHPRRVYVFFVYLGAIVESLTGTAGSLLAQSHGNPGLYETARTLSSVALVLQGAVEGLFINIVWLVHRRYSRDHNERVPKNISRLCMTLYGTSILILFRCVFRAIESFSSVPAYDPNYACHGLCQFTSSNEWYLYVFEGAPMILYTFWLNIVHPGRLLPRERLRYLDIDGRTERIGPGWIDRRSKWQTFVDPFDLGGMLKGEPSHEMFWTRPDQWPEVSDGNSFVLGTASNIGGHEGLRLKKVNVGNGSMRDHVK